MARRLSPVELLRTSPRRSLATIKTYTTPVCIKECPAHDDSAVSCQPVTKYGGINGQGVTSDDCSKFFNKNNPAENPRAHIGYSTRPFFGKYCMPNFSELTDLAGIQIDKD